MAQAGLGHIYGTPFGVRGDRDKAEYWLQKAIDQGTEAAQETRMATYKKSLLNPRKQTISERVKYFRY